MSEAAFQAKQTYLVTQKSIDVENKKIAGNSSVEEEGTNSAAYSSNDNPIDNYYIPIIRSDASEARIRWAQDTYCGVWKAEFDDLLKCLKKKCVYKKDRKKLQELKKQIQRDIKTERNVWETELMQSYSIDPDPVKSNKEIGYSRRSLYGNGTRSRLNQAEGELYRDACIRIIRLNDNSYVFREIDYAKQNYE